MSQLLGKMMGKFDLRCKLHRRSFKPLMKKYNNAYEKTIARINSIFDENSQAVASALVKKAWKVTI